MNTNPYDDAFFESQGADMARAASLVVPLVFRFIQPKSVIDIGCGRGAWLRAFKECGVETIRGIDGDYVDRGVLLIQQHEFGAQDLNKDFDLVGDYDLAVCLEVAEHLLERTGHLLVRKLTQAAPAVLFSAAVPGQGGTHHVNEQWPEYWRELFRNHGYERLDCVRPLIWQNKLVPFYYRQNMYLYCSSAAIAQSAILEEEFQRSRTSDLELVHVDIMEKYKWLRGVLQVIPPMAMRSLRRRFAGARSSGPTQDKRGNLSCLREP